jgi:hypothetical protein
MTLKPGAFWPLVEIDVAVGVLGSLLAIGWGKDDRTADGSRYRPVAEYTWFRHLIHCHAASLCTIMPPPGTTESRHRMSWQRWEHHPRQASPDVTQVVNGWYDSAHAYCP